MHTNLSLTDALCPPNVRRPGGPRPAAAPGAPPAGLWRRLRAAVRAHRAAMAAAAREKPRPDPDLRMGAAPEGPRWAPFSPRF